MLTVVAMVNSEEESHGKLFLVRKGICKWVKYGQDCFRESSCHFNMIGSRKEKFHTLHWESGKYPIYAQVSTDGQLEDAT